MTPFIPTEALNHFFFSLFLCGIGGFFAFLAFQKLITRLLELGFAVDYESVKIQVLSCEAAQFFDKKSRDLDKLGFQKLDILIDRNAEAAGLFLYEALFLSADGMTLAIVTYRDSKYLWLDAINFIFGIRKGVQFRSRFSDGSDLLIKCGGFGGNTLMPDTVLYKLSRWASAKKALDLHRNKTEQIREENDVRAIPFSNVEDAADFLRSLTQSVFLRLQTLWPYA